MLTVEEYANIMRVHPTLAEALFEAASELVGKAVHVPPRRKKRGEK
jgi:dihydrolipoamide dehydrogenase